MGVPAKKTRKEFVKHDSNLNLCMLGNLSSTDFKKKFRKTIRVSNSLNPDQDQCSVSPDLDPKCLQRL